MNTQFSILVLSCIIIVMLLCYFYGNVNEYFISSGNNDIPKIIHQMAPADKSKWPKTWFICQNTWKKHFPSPEYQYILWTDSDLDNLVRKHYAWFYPIYSNYDKKIKKIDISRYMILHKYGGIYADMDYYCNKNFYNKLNQKKINIVESPYKNNEYIQNSLMASPIKNNWWLRVLDQAKSTSHISHPNTSTGPRLISLVYYKNKDDINVLDQYYYNPKLTDPHFKSNKIYTKHYLTSVWTSRGYGKNIRDNLFN